jgi:hypothetical protein
MKRNNSKWTFPSRCKFNTRVCGIVKPDKITGVIRVEFSFLVVVGLLGQTGSFLGVGYLIKSRFKTGLKGCGIRIRGKMGSRSRGTNYDIGRQTGFSALGKIELTVGGGAMMKEANNNKQAMKIIDLTQQKKKEEITKVAKHTGNK